MAHSHSHPQSHSHSQALALSASQAQSDIDLYAAAALTPQLLASFDDALAHIERIEQRIADTHSRVLVTGDLNAGKSTFVNTILRRQIAPDDQQPCTALFVEVLDPHQNMGVEEVHAVYNTADYNPTRPESFVRHSLAELRTIVEENEQNYTMLKVYCRDNRDEASSLLHNGVVDISFIDSPGLNIDSMKTMSLFAKQEEIDVIVFVVNAENHFTLSGREFLATATKEKAFVFVVVNRFDMIRRKDRCRRDILEQIKSISQQTFDEAQTLVHFVSARLVLEGDLSLGPRNPEAEQSFTHLEDCLRSFILEKRSRSKLSPAKVFLDHVVNDAAIIARQNARVAQAHVALLSSLLATNAPTLERMMRLQDNVLADMDRTIDATAQAIDSHARLELGDFLAEIEPFADGVEWPGLLHAWHYAHSLRQVVFRLATVRIRRCHDFARDKSLACVANIERLATNAMAEPQTISTAAISAAFEQNQLAASSPDDVVLQMSDLFDISDRVDIAKDYVPGVMLFTGGMVGYRGLTTGALNIAGSLSNTRIIKLAFAGLGLVGLGFIFYVLSDMRSSIQKKVTRKMKDHFAASAFVSRNTDLLTKTSRKVLQSTMWEFQTKFKRALAESEQTISSQNQSKLEAEAARDFYENAVRRAGLLKEQLADVALIDE
eukprot:jgi/Hompol1/4092/HPOL_003465-RA